MKALKPLIAMIAASATLLAASGPGISDIPIKDIDGKNTSLNAYKGKVVLVDFWTYSCINCLRKFFIIILPKFLLIFR